ncbi:ly6/PLAUR domain-containing protein 6 isoform X2 [Thunnus albacares]|uniref:ly6/PLAUR domain-containing protein 6 isoform X2 n=1 Tax=Thunnus albacares TaxID=8236 RepID=UPI001CF6E885|nr:ly6/PLAUR domain-containing protein 6 isoform X2 [Thunnus albacares]
MEHWPTVAWVLVLTVILDLLKAVHTRDFTEQDIIYLHPSKAKYCYTRHTIDVEGDSVSVTKRCVALEDCLSAGCTEMDHEGNKVCIACCEGNICNLPVPWNETDAILTTTSPLSNTVGLLQSYALTFSLIIGSFIVSSGV